MRKVVLFELNKTELALIDAGLDCVKERAQTEEVYNHVVRLQRKLLKEAKEGFK
jgi:hypothetical protein